MPKPPELVAPAGDWECARAAVENGADAVYFGLSAGFNARARAANFTAEQLPELMTYLRRRGVKGYVTLNTLVFPGELGEFEQLVRLAVTAGVDAAIVQDLGAARLVRAVCPTWPIHASTQMTLTSAECLRAVAPLGIGRVVLPRELSIAEIAALRRETSMALEVFIHGALCISYSGQCLASLALGGRSANRGQCAQPCRLPYALRGASCRLADRRASCQLAQDGSQAGSLGHERQAGSLGYVLSPHDLAAYDRIAELMAAGVDALKIEGRLKPPEYVANITRYYREAVDAAAAGRPVKFTPRQVAEMEVSFSRGFSHGWLDGRNHQTLVPGRSSTKRGALLGTVYAVRGAQVLVTLCGAVSRGDGVVFEEGRAAGAEQGGRVFEVFQDGEPAAGEISAGTVGLAFGRDAIDLKRVVPGQKVWKTDDPRLARRLRRSYAEGRSQRRVPLDLVVEAAVGQLVRISGRADSGATCSVQWPEPLPEALKHPLTQEVLAAQLGRLGGSCYRLRTLEARIEGRPMLPLSVLGKLRQAILRELDASLAAPQRRQLAAAPLEGDSPIFARAKIGTVPGAKIGTVPGAKIGTVPRLHVLCRTPAQLEAALGCGASSVVADFREPGECGDAVRRARAAGATIFVATPRIHRPGEDGFFRLLGECGADGILARNLAGLEFFRPSGVPLVADFSLNAANGLAVEWLHERGACRVTASYDLGRNELLHLAASVPPAWLEVVVHRHVPMFHTEHCLFCAAFSSGRDRGDCGRPCAQANVRLRDRRGAEHPLRADAGCRNTVFSAVPQSLAEGVPLLLKRGVSDFRVELLEEEAAGEVAAIVTLYRDLVAGQVTGRDAWRLLHDRSHRRIARAW